MLSPGRAGDADNQGLLSAWEVWSLLGQVNRKAGGQQRV